MDLIAACEILEQQGLPIPSQQCDNCLKTIYRKDHRFQCPDCGARSTQYGGLFTHAGKASQEWIDACAEAQKFIKTNTE
jgi:uncharacterized Zn finger protein (UPF0148 family)